MTTQLAGRRVLITGGAGFIGSAVCRQWAARGAEVHALVRTGADLWRLEGVPGVAVHAVDLRDPSAEEVVRRVRPAWIIDTAAEGGHFEVGDRDARLERHLTAVEHVLRGAASAGATRVVHLGSSTEYGSHPGLVDEATPCRPSTPRGEIKLATTKRCLSLAAGAGIEAVVLRLFHVYGPGEQPDRLIPTAMAAGLDRRPLSITATDPARDYVYVDDVVEACALAATAAGVGGEIFNVGTGVATSNRELLAALQSAMGVQIALDAADFPARAADAERRVADVSKARAGLAWSPRTPLRAGLATTVAWKRTRQDAGVPR